MGAVSKPQACYTENARFVVLVSHVQQFETYRKFSLISTDLLCLQHAQMPRSRDLVIFILTTTMMTTTDIQTDYFTPCACAQGNYYVLHFWGVFEQGGCKSRFAALSSQPAGNIYTNAFMWLITFLCQVTDWSIEGPFGYLKKIAT